MDSWQSSNTVIIYELSYLHQTLFQSIADSWPAGLWALVYGWAVALTNTDHLLALASWLWMDPRWDRSATPALRAKETFTRWPKDLEECGSDQYSWRQEE